ncbi:sensor histidine kinase [Cellulomonas xiejunii]|uniref:histidine kinase n=1 Tax=Cellulomonas xiejunii TaxID=2968083 RepID=A0ABY5KPU6_9CELL|nr:histidine kinase [Cellulomonas xiejunii]MCC2322360.1 histidine kinase [Cellulomonas xiejunii]UUI72410.1 histidine kinase [Cellulomonas xiejunii]
MIIPAGSRSLPAPRAVGAWLLAPLRANEQPEPSRTRLGRLTPWIAVVAAVVTPFMAFDRSRVEGLGMGAAVAAAVAVSVTVALLGWQPLNAWRFAAAVAALWIIFGPAAEESVSVLPLALPLVLLIAGVAVLARHRRALGWAGWAWTVVLVLLGVTGEAAVLYLVVFTLLMLVVDARRQRTRARAEAASEREARLTREAESMVLEERARIARELHDVVAHHMSMVAVQAETAPYRLEGVPDPVREEFGSIARSARAALTDVRGILTVLRDVDADVERAPQPGLDGLEALVDSARAAGSQVELTVTGRRRPLSAALEIGGYRIVQESLANAARHAPGAVVAVAVAYRKRELEVVVTNGPPTSPVASPATGDGAPDEGGHGLAGMRERAHLLGGDVAAGPTPDGGFRVAATLPLKEGTA